MRRLRRRILITTVALVAAVVLYLVITLPPAARHLAGSQPGVLYGAYHVHSNRSDGSGDFEDIATAAAAAGLQYVIVTDHGDATRPPDRPQYLHGVLMIDAVEISTIEGHLVALGLNEPSPFPLGGEARDTQEDVHRMGGWTVVAHPDSPRPGLRWRGDVEPADAVEWFNADSEWRDEPAPRLIRVLGQYLFRPPEAIASIFTRPSAALRRWDDLSRSRNVIAIAGVDAHARIGGDKDGEPRQSRTFLARPSYKDMFRTVSQAVVPGEPLSGDAIRDAGRVLDALRAGRSYSVVRAIAVPGLVNLSATDGTRNAGMGESLVTSAPVTVVASVPEPADAVVVLLRDGAEVARGTASASYTANSDAAVYRAEVRLEGHAVPWIVTNQIRIGALPIPPTTPPPVSTVLQRLDNPAAWSPEKHPESRSDIRIENGEVAMEYRLAAGPPNGQYAAVSYPLDGTVPFDSIGVTLRANAPTRVSVQVRQPAGIDGERWHRTVYIDPTPRTVTLRLDDFRLGEVLTDRKPSPGLVRSLLLVVDTWHTSPGTSGTIWISGVSLGGPAGTTSAR